jgi:hypothetical protein
MFLRSLSKDLLLWSRDGRSPRAVAEEDERRLYIRFRFGGMDIPLRCGKLFGRAKLKDLSCMGASGLIDLPLALDDVVYLNLSRSLWVAAEVRWVRNTMAGLKFIRPLELGTVRELQVKHRGELRRRRLPD